jgi:cytochrome c-type biogenesis protein CcsB
MVATGVTSVGFAAQTAALIMRWVESYQMGIGHAPLSNLYESLVFFVWSLILIYLIFEFKYRNKSFGAFVTPVAGLALAFIEMSGMSKDIAPLAPALQSNWLIAHVLISFLGYAAFAVSFGTALMYLIVFTEKKTEPAYVFWTLTTGVFVVIFGAMGIDFLTFKVSPGSPDVGSVLLKATFRNGSGFVAAVSWVVGAGAVGLFWLFGGVLKKVLGAFSLSEHLLDDVTYRSIAIGFPLLTLGIITGAIWADSAWGTYWSWDPKETWSLITWFVYALYLHSRFVRGWRGRKTAVLAVLGFIAVIFTYLGVNLLLSGLHSYGGQ